MTIHVIMWLKDANVKKVSLNFLEISEAREAGGLHSPWT